MYNRYIPRPDGSFQRNRMPERGDRRPAPSQSGTQQSQRPQQQERPRCPQEEPQQARPRPQQASQQENCGPDRQESRQQEACPPSRPAASENRSAMSAGSFLKQLLPKDCDTGDLLIIVLLLLMAGDCKEEKNTALLTLALYLFM